MRQYLKLRKNEILIIKLFLIESFYSYQRFVIKSFSYYDQFIQNKQIILFFFFF